MIRTIYITWRKKTGDRRYIIAKLKRNVEGITFSYTKGFEEAQQAGLDFFSGFKNIEKINSQEIENWLSLRLISKERPDRHEHLAFWEIENTLSSFDEIAFTQGKSPTDNFEFLADFLFVKSKKLVFVTDLAGLSHLKIPIGQIKVGDVLSYQREYNNPMDQYAIAVFKNDLKIGYIKQIHNRIFAKLKRKLHITVKAVDENGFIKQVFVKVEKRGRRTT